MGRLDHEQRGDEQSGPEGRTVGSGARSPSSRCVPLAVLLLVVGAGLLAPERARADSSDHASLVNRRVVQKQNDFALHIEDRVVDRGRVIHIYRVEQVNGPWLWIRSEGNGFRGWALADHVVPIEEGVDYFTRQIAANPQDVFSHMMRAVLWQDRREIDKAVSDFDAALRIDPNQGWVLNNRGILHFERDDHARALADFDQALRLEPSNANVLNNRGNVRRARKLYDLAIADFSEAIRIAPGYEYAYFNRGLAWADKKEYDRAIADFDEAIRLDPTDALTYYHRGLAWSAKGEYGNAVEDFDHTVKLDKGLVFAYRDRGRARAAQKDYAGAIRDLDRAIELDPRSARAHYWRGLVRVETREFDKALADYDAAIRLDPRVDEVYLSRAWLLASCPNTRFRDPKRAVESATRACELTHWHQAHDIGGLAAVYAETGNVAAALKWHSKAIELMTGSGEFGAENTLLNHQ